MSLCLPPWSPTCSNLSNNNTFSYLSLHGVSSHFPSPMPKLSSPTRNPFRHFCSFHTDDLHVPSLSDAKSISPEQEGSAAENKASGRGVFPKTNEMVEKLKRYGIAGVLSYGLLNTAYYSITFLLVWDGATIVAGGDFGPPWSKNNIVYTIVVASLTTNLFASIRFYVAPPPAKMGYVAAVKRFLKTMAMVWAGSQVTKILRAGGAVALAPFMDTGLSWFTAKFKFKSKGQAFTAIVLLCLGLAILLFFFVTLVSA